METHLAAFMLGTPEGEEAEDILRKCVHCGFCTATCPTYQILGDELDGPRGRIYLIKQVLEGAAPTATTQLHLDRCLTCLSCETTCPSGVKYGRLVEIGRKVVADQLPGVTQPARAVTRWLLREGLTRPALFATALFVGRSVRGVLPKPLRNKVPPRLTRQARVVRASPPASERMVLLSGCVQPALSPEINAATVRVLAALGVNAQPEARAGCCGAIRAHLDDPDGALDAARRNIDAWIDALDAGASTIVMTASGCGSMVKEYGHLLRNDPAYTSKAQRISKHTLDLCEVISARKETLATLIEAARPHPQNPGAVTGPLAYHPPCSLQHAQRITGQIEAIFLAIGISLRLPAQSHLCCGSAGTYSILQPALSNTLRQNKLVALEATGAKLVVSANIGCITHLQSATATPVRHWIEVIDLLLAQSSSEHAA